MYKFIVAVGYRYLRVYVMILYPNVSLYLIVKISTDPNADMHDLVKFEEDNIIYLG